MTSPEPAITPEPVATPSAQADEPARHSREDLLSLAVAASFGVAYETLAGAFHLAGIKVGQLLSRTDVEAALKAHAERIIP